MMKHSTIFIVLFCIASNVSSGTADLKISSDLMQFQKTDTICKVWIYFTDKIWTSETKIATPRSLARRAASGYQTSMSDYPVNDEYISEIVEEGGVTQRVNKWENSVSFLIHTSKLNQISKLPFVKKITSVNTIVRDNSANLQLNKSVQTDDVYSEVHKKQLNLLHISQAHYYLYKTKNGAEPGQGVFIGFFDSGFRLDHVCFSYLKEKSKLKAAKDFVDLDNDPQDSDSSLNHGSIILAQAAGYDEGVFTGSSWGADIALARTEISESELHIEEDNWVAALVWAESLGVDIVSSSLGYNNTFEDSILINGEYVTDYSYNHFDGNSTVISRAAKNGVDRGMLIVNAIGNEGNSAFGTLTAPSDVDGVIAVGSVNPDTVVSSFSSTGPTADGRIKPDCVAPGQGVIVPSFSSSQSPYMSFHGGTSFSTPLVTGVVAMIIQSMENLYNAENVRNKLFKYCRFIPNQDAVDNRAGRGLPDALLSIMGDSELFIEVTDTANRPLINATAQSISGNILGFSDDAGVLIIDANAVSGGVIVSVPGDTTEPLMFQSTPAYKLVSLNSTIDLNIYVQDVDKNPIQNCLVSCKIDNNDSTVLMRNTNKKGHVSLAYGKEAQIKIFVSSPVYYSPDTIAVNLSTSMQPVVVTLQKIPSNVFVVYPNVIKNTDRKIIKALFSYATKGFNPALIKAFVCSVDGTVVWRESKLSEPGNPSFFLWNGTNTHRPVAPGIYYFVIQFKKETFRKKFLIAG